ncbi:hypothetical protein MCOR13_005844 [Pyricularia oryzae]|nr:hypothetical protein MCOR13_005844 [Pyricularia oryzae]
MLFFPFTNSTKPVKPVPANAAGTPLWMSSLLALILNLVLSSSDISGGHAASSSSVGTEFSRSLRSCAATPSSEAAESRTVSWISSLMDSREGFPGLRRNDLAAARSVRRMFHADGESV